MSSVEGGALFCKEEDTAHKVFEMRYFGKDASNQEVSLGTNAKMSEFNAAFGLLSMKDTAVEIGKRRSIAAYYKSALKECTEITFQSVDKEIEINHAYFPIILRSEQLAVDLLKTGKENGVEFRRYFYPSLGTIQFISDKVSDTPIANDISNRILCLPVYGTLTAEELEHIVGVIKSVLNYKLV